MIARVAMLAVLMTSVVAAQGGRAGGAAQRPPSPREAAPVDLTGYWVSVVSEDWRFRIATPRKGDTGGGPLNPAGRTVAEAWDPARDAASGNECRWYGAAGIMRVPGRLHLGRSHQPATEASWQGDTVASWDGAGGRAAGPGPRWASLRAVTTRLRPGYLRRNGVPYSQDAVLTEYFDRHSAPDGSEWITVTSIVFDPTYLTQEFITSTDFKKEPDGAKWSPTPCGS